MPWVVAALVQWGINVLGLIVADAVDLQTALYLAAAGPAIGAVVCLFLPSPAARRAPAVEPTPAAIV